MCPFTKTKKAHDQRDSLKYISVQIILLFASKITLKPISPQLLRDAASNLHHQRVRARFCVPSHVPEVNPTAWTAARILSWHSHEQHLCSCRQHPGSPQQPFSPRNHHILPSLLWPFLLRGSHLSLTRAFATSDLFSHRTFCFIITICHHWLDCHRLSRLFYACWGKNPSTFPLQILISLSGKIPHENLAFIVAVYFYLVLLCSTNCCPLPMPPVLTSGQHFL